jgi:hypothetical protein
MFSRGEFASEGGQQRTRPQQMAVRVGAQDGRAATTCQVSYSTDAVARNGQGAGVVRLLIRGALVQRDAEGSFSGE